MDICRLHHTVMGSPGIQVVESSPSYEDWRGRCKLPRSSRCSGSEYTYGFTRSGMEEVPCLYRSYEGKERGGVCGLVHILLV